MPLSITCQAILPLIKSSDELFPGTGHVTAFVHRQHSHACDGRKQDTFRHRFTTSVIPGKCCT